MPTEMRSNRMVNGETALSLNIALAERISVFTCATDYCLLLCPLAQQRGGILLSDAQSLDHCTIACIADATKIIK